MRTPLIVELVVIARNSAVILQKIYGDPGYLALLDKYFDRRVYVDSSSDDGSVAVMQQAGFTCLLIESHGRMSAAASRAVAASRSTADVIFFLDGDMIFDNVTELASHFQEFYSACENDSRICGFTGRTVDVYPDDRTRERSPHRDSAGHSLSFGGFVAFERASLLAAGNWNGNVVANEELELHARLRQVGKRVYYAHNLIVRHHTEVASPWWELAAAYLPLRPDRYGAFGMAMRASADAGSLPALFSLMPEPFVLMASLVVITTLWVVFGCKSSIFWFLMLMMMVSYAAWVASRRGLKFIFVVPSLLVSLPWGLLRYRQLSVVWRQLENNE